MHWKSGGITQSEFQKEVVDRTRRVFDAIRPDPDMGTGQDEPHPAGTEVAQKWAMVKYDRVDAKPTREMLRTLRGCPGSAIAVFGFSEWDAVVGASGGSSRGGSSPRYFQ